jgi:hypothetical protein
MNEIDVGTLTFGPFKTEWFKRAVDARLREAAFAFLQQRVLQLEGKPFVRIEGGITSHYDAPQFAKRPDLHDRYFLKLEVDTPEGIVGVKGEIVYDRVVGEFTESRVKPVEVRMLKPRPGPREPIKKPGRTAPHVRFAVAEVTPCAEALPGAALGPALEAITKTKLLCCPDSTRQVVPRIDFHPLIAAAAVAFQKHYPLVLSPDIIWVTVLQGVSQHVQNHAERLRSRLVRHEGKLELVVDLGFDALPRDNAQMLMAAQAFCREIGLHLQSGKQALFEAQFTTTTEVEQIAANIVLMEALQPYFDYLFSIICGIPSVILEGTVADWELLEKKVRVLDDSDLELSWWTGQLLPLCRHFSRAAAGDVDVDHWKNLCKVVEWYGVDDLNGWLLKFIPYVRYRQSEQPIHRNPVLDLKPGKKPRLSSGREITGCTSDMLPTGVSAVPVTLLDKSSGRRTLVRFVGGFTGLEQAHEDLGLRPFLGWAISEPPLIDVLIEKLRRDYGCVPPRLSNDLGEVLPEALPSDMWKFYAEIEAVEFPFREPNQWGEPGCMLYPGSTLKRLWDTESVREELQHLSAQGLISKALCEEREEFVRGYGDLVCIGGAEGAKYVFGAAAPDWKKKLGVYRWTGERRPEAFTRISDSFTEWLAELIGISAPKLRKEDSDATRGHETEN